MLAVQFITHTGTVVEGNPKGQTGRGLVQHGIFHLRQRSARGLLVRNLSGYHEMVWVLHARHAAYAF